MVGAATNRYVQEKREVAIEDRPLQSRGDCKRCFNERRPLVIAKRHGMSNQLYLDPPATDCADADGRTATLPLSTLI